MTIYLHRSWFGDIWHRRLDSPNGCSSVDYRWGLRPRLYVLPGAYEMTWGPFQVIVRRRKRQ